MLKVIGCVASVKKIFTLALRTETIHGSCHGKIGGIYARNEDFIKALPGTQQ
jgi:hypothetical protein